MLVSKVVVTVHPRTEWCFDIVRSFILKWIVSSFVYTVKLIQVKT